MTTTEPLSLVEQLRQVEGPKVPMHGAPDPKPASAHPNYFNGLAHELVTLSASRLGRDDNRVVGALLEATRVILDIDARVRKA